MPSGAAQEARYPAGGHARRYSSCHSSSVAGTVKDCSNLTMAKGNGSLRPCPSLRSQTSRTGRATVPPRSQGRRRLTRGSGPSAGQAVRVQPEGARRGGRGGGGERRAGVLGKQRPSRIRRRSESLAAESRSPLQCALRRRGCPPAGRVRRAAAGRRRDDRPKASESDLASRAVIAARRHGLTHPGRVCLGHAFHLHALNRRSG